MSMLPSEDSARRMMRLSQSAQPPLIGITEHAAWRLALNGDCREIREGQQRTSQYIPLASLRRRIRTVDDATRLQLVYHTMYSRFAGYEPATRRLDLIHGPTHSDPTGALCAYLTGLVVDVADNGNGETGRICLESPTMTSTPYRFEGTPIDTHLWLHANGLHPDGDYADANDPDPRLREGYENGDRIAVGDMLVIAARLHAYTDTRGRKRLGVGEWRPLGCSMYYGLTDGDGRDTIRFVPRHLVQRLTVLAFDADGMPRWSDPLALHRELDEYADRWPDLGRDLRISVVGSKHG